MALGCRIDGGQAKYVRVQNAIAKYDPNVIGCKWDDSNPRIQLEPRGERGYIELKVAIAK